MAAAARTAQPNTTTPVAPPLAGTSHWPAELLLRLMMGKASSIA